MLRYHHPIRKGDDDIPKSYFFTFTGQAHAAARQPGEDHAAAYDETALSVAVVCDGAGSAAAGGAAAALVSRFLARTLAEQFQEFYLCDGATARMRVTRQVTEKLQAHSRISGIPEQELACTILAAAMDKDGRCVCFHLGDGIILQKDRGREKLSVVSAPMNGLTSHSTYLTMNCEMWRYLRYYRWQSAETEQLLLLSDGAAEHLVRRQGGAGWTFNPDLSTDPDCLQHYLHRQKPIDDYTMAQIIQK